MTSGTVAGPSPASPDGNAALFIVAEKFIRQSKPQPGCIIGCFTPDKESGPADPGKKFRPVLVIEGIESLDGPRLRVAYGTAQDTSFVAGGGSLHAWELEFEPNSSNRLTQFTKIEFDKVFDLPFSERFFHWNGKVTNFANFTSRRDEMLAALTIGKTRPNPAARTHSTPIITRKVANTRSSSKPILSLDRHPAASENGKEKGSEADDKSNKGG